MRTIADYVDRTGHKNVLHTLNSIDHHVKCNNNNDGISITTEEQQYMLQFMIIVRLSID